MILILFYKIQVSIYVMNEHDNELEGLLSGIFAASIVDMTVLRDFQF